MKTFLKTNESLKQKFQFEFKQYEYSMNLALLSYFELVEAIRAESVRQGGEHFFRSEGTRSRPGARCALRVW